MNTDLVRALPARKRTARELAMPGWRASVWLLATLLTFAACGEGGSSMNGEGRRALSGLSRCSVRIPGYYYIGAVLPFTGSLAAKARSRELAVMQALTEINEQGGLGPDRRPIGLVSCDTKKEPAVALAVVQELGGASPVSVSAIVGPATSACTFAAADAAERFEIPLISPSATSPELNKPHTTAPEPDFEPASPAPPPPDPHPFVFRTAMSDDFQGAILAAIAKRDGHETVFVIYRDDAYGQGLRDEFAECFTDEDCAASYGRSGRPAPDSVRSRSYVETELDAAAIVREAIAAEPDAVLLISYVADGAAILKAASNAGWQTSWLLSDGVKDPGLIRDVGGVPGWLDGAVGTTPSYLSGDDYDTFTTEYRALWGAREEPLNFSANAYDAVYLIAIAMSLANDPEDGALVANALLRTGAGEPIHPEEWAEARGRLASGSGKLDYEGASGPVDFDRYGDVLGKVGEWTIAGDAILSKGCWTDEAAPCDEP